MRILLLLTAAFALVATTQAQPLFEEEFDYSVGSLLTDNGWTSHSGSGNFITVTADNQTFSGYPAMSGNAVTLEGGSGSREDVNRQLATPVSTGNVYVSALVNPSSASTDGYFLHGGPTVLGTTFRGRLFVREDATSSGFVNFGISKASSSTVEYDPMAYATGMTYLVVMKYTFVDGDDNDTVDLYVFEAGDDISTEPATPDASNVDSGSDLSEFGTIALRQGGEALLVVVDGIRIGTAWMDTVVPVELTAFDALLNGNDVALTWETVSETNNSGFEVQMRGDGQYQALGFVEGNGTTTEAQTYGYTVHDLAPGSYTFRLKQIDYDGAFEYSPEVEVGVGVPGTHTLSSAYPNPFNPEATFSLSVAAEQNVEIALYNSVGQQVATIYSGRMQAGQARTFTISGAGLPSGSYVYRAVGERFVESGRVTLLK